MFSSKTNRHPLRASRRHRPAFVLVVLACPALACGPFFPATIINRHDALLAAPFVRFADSLAKIPSPPAAFRAVAPTEKQSLADQTLAAELADLAAAGVAPALRTEHAVRRRTLAELDAPPPGRTLPRELSRTDGLPAEFALYHAGAFCFAQGDGAVAAENWRRLLALPASERRYKSTWAAFMLGRHHQTEAPATARDFFQQTRQFARDGFSDTLGLAAASLGWEAKTHFDTGAFATAAEFYLDQLATGDGTAANSLRFLAARLLSSGTAIQLDAFAADARLREIPTAALLAWRERDWTLPLGDGATARWLAALERARVTAAPHAAHLALVAYRAAQFPACTRWLSLAAPDDDLALWLRAKLALRDGLLPEAAALLSRLVRHSARTDNPLAALAVAEESESPPKPALAHLRAELATVKLASRDYAEALALLLDADYWEDAAYVAERVLTVDELKNFVVARFPLPAPPPALADTESSQRFTQPPTDLRYLLARRLVRHHRPDEARAFFPAALAPVLDRFLTLLRAGHDRAQSAAVRAASLMEAARLLRADGMALRGTELTPDFAIWGGDFTSGISLAERESLPAPLRATRDEHWRASAQDTGHGQRFHYRYFAADLAWEAIALLPDETDATARALVEAGGWLKNRDPRAANRFYVALVQRCGTTALGRAAAQQHWFPAKNF